MASTLAETKAAVLARVREAGDEGAPAEVLVSAGWIYTNSAIVDLMLEGRVRSLSGARLALTAAQRELDALLAECPPTLPGSKGEG